MFWSFLPTSLYESGYKLTKGETESDLTKYLGGKAAHEALINKIEGVLESYKRMFLLTALAVVAAIILAYILACLIKASEPKLANQNQNILWVLDNGHENIVNIDHIFIYPVNI